MRFAGQLMARLGTALKDLAPKSVGEAALEFGPDIAFSVLAGMSAPEGWQVPLAGEELALNLGGSVLGRLAGRSIGKRVIPNVNTDLGKQQLGYATNIGSMAVAAPVAMFGPRPVFNAMLADQQQQQAAAQEAQATEIQRITREQLLNSLMVGGTTGVQAIAGMSRPAQMATQQSITGLMGVV